MDTELAAARVLVTGGAGFLGSHVVARLQTLGADTVVPSSRDFDLTRADDAERLFQLAQAQVVIHLAARVGGIGANQANPGRFFYDNLMMGMHVIDAARRHGAAKIVLVGTSCSYPRDAPMPFREEDLWNGYPEATNAPYGLAKRALVAMVGAYRQQYGLRGISLIPANLYGPGDSFDLATGHVIPMLIRKFIEAKEAGCDAIVAWGTGRASREFLYVDDAAEGIVLATERYDGTDPVNLGTGEQITIRDLVEEIRQFVGFAGRVEWDAGKPDGQPRRQLDVRRARQEFGFVARTPLREGLRQTVAWFVKQRADENALQEAPHSR